MARPYTVCDEMKVNVEVTAVFFVHSPSRPYFFGVGVVFAIERN